MNIIGQMVQARAIPDVDVTYLNRRLTDRNGRMRLWNAASLNEIDPHHLRIWANKNSRYVLPTAELIDWLKQKINGRKAIEIGAGMGDLGYHLGIHMTDSYMQQQPEIAAYYAAIGAATTKPPPDVEKLDAIEAIEKHQPEVVVGSYITQKFVEGDDVARIGSSVYGPDHFEIMTAPSVKAFILIGNTVTHRGIRAVKVKHELFKFPWLKTRSEYQNENCIWVWGE